MLSLNVSHPSILTPIPYVIFERIASIHLNFQFSEQLQNTQIRTNIPYFVDSKHVCEREPGDDVGQQRKGARCVVEQNQKQSSCSLYHFLMTLSSIKFCKLCALSTSNLLSRDWHVHVHVLFLFSPPLLPSLFTTCGKFWKDPRAGVNCIITYFLLSCCH